MPTLDQLYWGLLIAFGLMGLWHAILPPLKGQEYRTAVAALILYFILGIIGWRYFML